MTFSVSTFGETYYYDLFQTNLESFHNGWYQSQCGLIACFITNMLHCQLLHEFPQIWNIYFHLMCPLVWFGFLVFNRLITVGDMVARFVYAVGQCWQQYVTTFVIM